MAKVATIEYNDEKFRKIFPAFADDALWPEETLDMYWNLGRDDFITTRDFCFHLLNGSSLQMACDLLCAHLSTLMAIPPTTPPAGGGDVGGATSGGIVQSASIGAVSVSMLAPPVKGMWDYWLSQTPYGQQLLFLLSIKSVGGFYVGGLPERNGFRKVGGTFM